MGYWSEAMRAIKSADVVLFVIDSRFPELSRNKDLEDKLSRSDKQIFIIFNKIDLISSKKLSELKKENKNSYFVSVPDKIGINQLRVSLLKLGKKKDVKLEVGIVGYPNVGKSAITNILVRGNKTKVSSTAGTTTGSIWASSNQLKIIDSPGVIPYEDDELKLGILAAKNPEKLKNPEYVALEIIKLFKENSFVDLNKFYSINATDEEEAEDIFNKIGEARRLLKRGGVVDENRTALTIIKDWQKGRLIQRD